MKQYVHRLAAIYDIDNPDGPDHDYFRSMVDAANARTVIDLGCGTGILTVTLAKEGRSVIGIDPDPAMLARAESRPDGDKVEWRLGTSEQIEPATADFVIMSGNVAMHILRDEWHQALRDIADGLQPGGQLVFESRNPLAQAWRTWNDPLAERDTPFGPLRESTITDPPDASGIVTMHCFNQFLEDGSVIEIDQQLQFRGYERITQDLSDAGLQVVNVWSDWDRTPFTNTEDEPLMVFEAVKSTGT